MRETLSIAEFLERLGRFAPWSKAAEWDPVGLQLGDPQQPLRTLALCHEVTEAVVARVEDQPVDLLVSYHPLLFEPTRRFLSGRTPAGRALRLLRAEVALAVIHTNYDVAPGGTAEALADALGLVACTGFAPLHGPDSVKLVSFVPAEAADLLLQVVVRHGAARIGNYTHCSYRGQGTGTFFAESGSRPVVGQPGRLNREPEVRLEFNLPRARQDEVIAAFVAAHPYEEPAFDLYDRQGDTALIGRIGSLEPEMELRVFSDRVARELGDPVVRLAGEPGLVIARVAVVPGAGGEYLPLARIAGADVMVTGDLTHHRVQSALDQGLCVIDVGHVASERPGMKRLFAVLAALGVECRSLLDLDPDPWKRGA